MTWREDRIRLERMVHEQGRHSGPEGESGHVLFHRRFDRVVDGIVRASGLYGRGHANAHDLRLHRVDLVHDALPAGLDGYAILFLSDPHASAVPRLMEQAARMVDGASFDLVLLGGDYQSFGAPEPEAVMALMEPLLATLTARTPVMAVLGNHDTHRMADLLAGRGVRMLLNEHAVIERGGGRLVVVGLDDVHYFHTPAARQALYQAPDGFRLALIHSPEYAGVAAEAGCHAYLAGHTHAGQICLPGGRPVFTAVPPGWSHVVAGSWRHRGMAGYTSSGLGSGLPPVRFNCPPEMALVTLRRSAD